MDVREQYGFDGIKDHFLENRETYHAIFAAQERSNQDFSFLSEYEIQIEKASAGRKVVCSGRSDENEPLMEVIVYGAFKSPFENWIAFFFTD